MKKIFLAILILNILHSCRQSEEKNKDIKTDVVVDFSGDYSGTFSDLKNAEGKIKLSLYQSNNGMSGGIITLKKNGDSEKLVTGVINVMGNGKIINGNFTPSVINQTTLYYDNKKKLEITDSYQCTWSFYGEILGESGNLIIGKAVPMNCSESNLMEFNLEREK